jgi:hypothetical protein
MGWLRHGFRRAGKTRAILLTITALSVSAPVLFIPVDGGASGLAGRRPARHERVPVPHRHLRRHR